MMTYSIPPRLPIQQMQPTERWKHSCRQMYQKRHIKCHQVSMTCCACAKSMRNQIFNEPQEGYPIEHKALLLRRIVTRPGQLESCAARLNMWWNHFACFQLLGSAPMQTALFVLREHTRLQQAHFLTCWTDYSITL
jgi:hypothetical protein